MHFEAQIKRQVYRIFQAFLLYSVFQTMKSYVCLSVMSNYKEKNNLLFGAVSVLSSFAVFQRYKYLRNVKQLVDFYSTSRLIIFVYL